MPLVRITLAQGTGADHRRAIADGVHQALVETAAVPPDDRFQSVHEVPASDLHWSATYLGLERTASVVFVQIFLNVGRTVEVKKALYARIAEKLAGLARPAQGGRAREPGRGPARELVLRRRSHELPSAAVTGRALSTTGHGGEEWDARRSTNGKRVGLQRKRSGRWGFSWPYLLLSTLTCSGKRRRSAA